jgi:hypothetical protein
VRLTALAVVSTFVLVAATARADPPAKGTPPKAPDPRPTSLTLDVTPFSYVDIPYGYAYFEGDSGQPVRAYPTLARDMHAFGTPGPSDSADPRWVRDAWRITISNDTGQPLPVSHLRLVRDSYAPLPDRYVCVWAPKGTAVTPKESDVALRAADTQWPLLSDGSEFPDLAPHDVDVVLAKVVGAEPGIYRMHVAFDSRLIGGAEVSITGGDVTLFVPDRAGNHGVYLMHTPTHEADVARRVLRLSQPLFDQIATDSRVASWKLQKAPAGEIEPATREPDDRAFVSMLKQWRDLSTASADPKPGNAPDWVDAWAANIPESRTLAMFLLSKPETSRRGIEVLLQYRNEHPEDGVAMRMLMGAFLSTHESQDLAAAWGLWRDLERPPSRYTHGYYTAGFDLAVASGNADLRSELEASVKARFPDDLEILAARLPETLTQDNWRQTVDSLAGFCRYVDMLPDRDSLLAFNAIVWRVFHALTGVPSSGRAKAVRALLTRCPDTTRSLLQTDPFLWSLVPELRPTPPDVQMTESERLVTAEALGLSGRWSQAAQILESAVAAPSASVDTLELFADAQLRNENFTAAREPLERALARSNVPQDQEERLVGKSAFAALKSGRFDQFAQLYDRFAALTYPLQMATEKRAVPRRLRTLLRVMHGLATKSWDIDTDLWLWYQSDPFELLGGYSMSGANLFQKAMNDAHTARETTGDAARGVGRIPKSLLDVLEHSYLRLATGAVPDLVLSPEEEWRRGDSSAWQIAKMLRDGKAGEPFMIRARDGLGPGSRIDGRMSVLESKKMIPVDEWVQSHRTACAGAQDDVYLVPLFGERLDAEMALREAEVAAFGDYDLQKGAARMADALRLDPRNVDAWSMAAYLAAAEGDFTTCVSKAAEGLRLDPKLDRLLAPKLACEDAIEEQAQRASHKAPRAPL